MTITPEQRAREALDRHFVAGAAEIPLVDAIAAAIREAENDKLESLAQMIIAEWEWWHLGPEDMAERLRSLKHKD